MSDDDVLDVIVPYTETNKGFKWFGKEFQQESSVTRKLLMLKSWIKAGINWQYS